MSSFRTFITTKELFNITGIRGDSKLSGRIHYKAKLHLDEVRSFMLDLGYVGQTATVKVNGKDCGLRMCRPFLFDISKAIVKGDNTLEIFVSNTLVYAKRDHLSPAAMIPPSRLLGPVTLIENI